MGSGVVCFGELLLRLNAPGRELLLQSHALQVYVGGAEANVAVSLAQFGHAASMVSIVPDSPLGAACIGELRRHGVRTDEVRVEAGRLGVYFMATGASHRPSEIVYDRADSAFALAASDAIDWTHALVGAEWLHISGITPALGPQAAEATLRAARAARDRGLSVSFDCNYRAKLWEAWGGDPARIFHELMDQSDLVFADERAVALALGLQLPDGAPAERFQHAAEEAFDAFPSLQRLAATVRVEHSVDHHEMSAMLMSRERFTDTRTYSLGAIVDRIGTGDAFAAGILHGCLTGLDDQAALDFALAAACLKHSIPGDFNLVSVAQVEELLAGRGFAVRR
ncbi:MAG: sugar kinase [Gammaproteobacteria bacterium]